MTTYHLITEAELQQAIENVQRVIDIVPAPHGYAPCICRRCDAHRGLIAATDALRAVQQREGPKQIGFIVPPVGAVVPESHIFVQIARDKGYKVPAVYTLPEPIP